MPNADRRNLFDALESQPLNRHVRYRRSRQNTPLHKTLEIGLSCNGARFIPFC
jgi:hypothetical protein